MGLHIGHKPGDYIMTKINTCKSRSYLKSIIKHWNSTEKKFPIQGWYIDSCVWSICHKYLVFPGNRYYFIYKFNSELLINKIMDKKSVKINAEKYGIHWMRWSLFQYPNLQGYLTWVLKVLHWLSVGWYVKIKFS